MFPPPTAAVIQQGFVAFFLYILLQLLELAGMEGASMSTTDLVLLALAMQLGVAVYFLVPSFDRIFPKNR